MTTGDDGAQGLNTGKATAAGDVKRDRILGFFSVETPRMPREIDMQILSYYM